MGIKAVKFRGRHNSWRAMTALILGSSAIIVFIVLAILSAINKTATMAYGVIGIIAALVSLAGLIVSALATRERDIFMSVPVAGMIVNGISFLLYVIVYVIGLV